jgi:hypothetical protein
MTKARPFKRSDNGAGVSGAPPDRCFSSTLRPSGDQSNGSGPALIATARAAGLAANSGHHQPHRRASNGESRLFAISFTTATLNFVLVVGIAAALVPAFISWLVGQYVFRMDPIHTGRRGGGISQLGTSVERDSATVPKHSADDRVPGPLRANGDDRAHLRICRDVDCMCKWGPCAPIRKPRNVTAGNTAMYQPDFAIRCPASLCARAMMVRVRCLSGRTGMTPPSQI